MQSIPLGPVRNVVPHGGVRELASGIDGLYLSGRFELPAAFKSKLHGWKEAAQVDATTASLGGVEFSVSPGGLVRGYPFRLDHEAGALGFSPYGHRPAVRVQTRASALHSLGAEATAAFFGSLLSTEFGRVELLPSRVDLFMDCQGWMPSVDSRREFVCRATRRNGFEDDDHFEGLVFGSRKTGTTIARLYDKTRQLAGRLTYWPDLWGPAYNPAELVLRVEFELYRERLVERGAPTLELLFERQGGLWAYLCDEWLSHRVPTGDQTRSRWPVSEPWQVIQQATMRHNAVPAARVLERERAASLANILPGLTGYLSSLGALEGCNGLTDTMAVAFDHVLDYCDKRGEPFDWRIEMKRASGRCQ